MVAIGNFLAQHLPLATCLMPHGQRQRAEYVMATLRQLQLPQLTGLISTHTLRHTAIFVSQNSAIKSNAPLTLCLSLPLSLLPGLSTLWLANNSYDCSTHTHAETIRNNFTAGPNRKRKGTKSKRKYRKERKFTVEKPKV